MEIQQKSMHVLLYLQFFRSVYVYTEQQTWNEEIWKEGYYKGCQALD